MGLTEYVLLIVVVILIPLLIAGAVTVWSIEQARYRPKRARRAKPGSPPVPAPERPAEANPPAAPPAG